MQKQQKYHINQSSNYITISTFMFVKFINKSEQADDRYIWPLLPVQHKFFNILGFFKEAGKDNFFAFILLVC